MGNLNINDWSATASANDVIDSGINAAEGEPPGAVNDAMRGIMAALARFVKDNNGTLSLSGTPNAFALAAPNVAYTVLSSGLRITARAAGTCTGGASSLNLNALGAKDVKIFTAAGGESYPAAGQIRQGGHYVFEYDAGAASGSGAWILLNPSPDPNAGMTGEIRIWPTATAPTGWHLCDGSAVSRTTFAALFAVIGTTYGVGDGSSTFNLPDLRGRVPFGKDDMGGTAAGRINVATGGPDGTTLGVNFGTATRTIAAANLPAHTHGFTGTTGAAASGISVNSHTTGVLINNAVTGLAINAAATGVATAAAGAHTHADAGHAHAFPTAGSKFMTVAGQGGAGSSGNVWGNAGGADTTNSGAANLSTAPDHAHTVIDPTHAHTVSDPAHAHGVTDAGHIHAISDPTHAHGFSGTTDNGTGGGTALPTLNPGLILTYIIKT
jgi:microcystin-dependent protein